MADLVIGVANHGYSNDDAVYVSWLNAIYYVAQKATDYFKLATSAGATSYVQYTTPVTSGYVREVDSTAGVFTVTGLDHLEGKTVDLVSNGRNIGSFIVDSGSITSPEIVFSYYVGLPYTSTIRTMRQDVPTQVGTMQGRKMRTHKVVVRFYKTTGATVGNGTDSETIPFTDGELFTGDKDQQMPLGFDGDGYIEIKQTSPLPLTVTAIVPHFEVYG